MFETVPKLSQKEIEILLRVSEINNPCIEDSMEDIGETAFLIRQLSKTISEWEYMDSNEIERFNSLEQYAENSLSGEYDLYQAYLSSVDEKEFREKEPDIYYFCGKAIDITGKRGFLSEEDVEFFLISEAKSERSFYDKLRFLEELKRKSYSV